MKYAITLVVVAGLGLEALADDVTLKNGGRIVGAARVEGENVVVEMAIGAVTVPRSEVLAIVPGRTPVHEYQERYARIAGSRDAAAFFDLAEWAKGQGLTRYVEALYDRVLDLDPDHAGARAARGFVRRDEKWVRAGDLSRMQCMEPRTRVVPAPRRRLPARADVIPYTFGLPRYGRGRGSHVWGGGGVFVGIHVASVTVPLGAIRRTGR
jgi:hypothetical protein